MRFDEKFVVSAIHAHIERAAQMSVRWSRKRFVRKKLFPITVGALVAMFIFYAGVLAPPADFPVTALVKIHKGATLSEVAQHFKEEHLVRSGFMLKAAIVASGGQRSVIAGNYFFSGPQNVLTVARRLATGDFDIKPVRITIPEGANTREIAWILEDQLLAFDGEAFLKLAGEREGYLFPDTYFFIPGEEPEAILERMENNFVKQTATLQKEIALFGKPLPEVLTMASLLEEEAANLEDRRIIAGILWNRIKQGMALQVDAVFPYLIGKNSFNLTRADLKTDSPYNTYIHKGLPPGPITNPGLDAILAAVTPTKTNYVYYLSDRQGNFHYSVTYEQHLQAKTKYLGN